jgi:hypothetical protein
MTTVDVQQQPPAERAARVGAREVLLGESARLEDRDGERIAHRERCGGAGRGREVERAGLGRHAHVERDRGVARQRRGSISGQCDQRDVEALDDRQDGQQLLGLARVRDREHHVAGGDHADVAVHGLARVQEERGTPGAGERGGDLAAHVARLAHAGDHDAALAGEQQAAGLGEVLAEAVLEGRHGLGLGREHASPAGDQRVCGGEAGARDGRLRHGRVWMGGPAVAPGVRIRGVARPATACGRRGWRTTPGRPG